MSETISRPLLGALSLPLLPDAVAEWASIIPLVCHLANGRDDYTTAGKVALAGSLSVGYFPRLGSLSGIARLLNDPGKFSDHANSRGGTSLHVWDVLWGGSFPCANGAAVDSILKHCHRQPGHTNAIYLPDVLRQSTTGKQPAEHSGSSKQPGSGKQSNTAPPSFRRYQTLHVYNCKNIAAAPKSGRSLLGVQFKRIAPVLQLVLAGGLVALLTMVGAYGTAAILLCSTFSNAVASFYLTVERPPGYLQSNESTMDSACMLAAAHQNASVWYLFIGDRGVADSLLNKPMFFIPDSRAGFWVGKWFKAANFLQLVAMTFAASQKSWDGICLLVLLAANWLFELATNSDANLAQHWMGKEGVDVDVRTFKFSGRSIMLGAIQLHSKSNTASWMDDIMTPHPRREAWLKFLEHGEKPSATVWNPADIGRIELTAGLAAESAQIIDKEFPRVAKEVV
ncbi:hypothetical protein OQA88_1498 [Cercophora sp. LCS_1]